MEQFSYCVTLIAHTGIAQDRLLMDRKGMSSCSQRNERKPWTYCRLRHGPNRVDPSINIILEQRCENSGCLPQIVFICICKPENANPVPRYLLPRSLATDDGSNAPESGLHIKVNKIYGRQPLFLHLCSWIILILGSTLFWPCLSLQ